jgi:hypothetical protein
MKLQNFSRLSRARKTTSGAGLADVLVSAAVFSLVIVGLVYTQLFCLRFDGLTNSKLGASDNGRLGFDLLTSDIRAAKQWYIGFGGSTGFTPCGNATNQIGNALQLSSSTDTNSYVRYFFDTNLCQLCRQVSGSTQYRVLGANLTNASGQGMSFIAQKYDGTQLSDLQFKYVIVTTLEFAQYQYPLTRVGPGCLYDYYRLQFKTASHNYN